MKEHKLFIFGLFALLAGCASQAPYPPPQQIQQIPAQSQRYEIDRLILQVEQHATTLARLELRGEQQSQEYKNRESLLADALKKLEEIRNDGNLNKNDIDKIKSFLRSEDVRKSRVMQDHNRRWQAIEQKYQ